MCGLAGLILKNKNVTQVREKITDMSQALQHRGPDGEGFFIYQNNSFVPYYDLLPPQAATVSYVPKQRLPENINEASVVFMHRRLSIIDLSATGHQPMCDKSENIWLTFNGEIYNYLELKAELIALGHTFVSHSDSEVILAAYQQWGKDCVQRFNGMWAFCLFDSTKNICFASRDRLGVKPFYYLDNNSLFAFASEQKAFIKSGLIKATVGGKAISNYLIQGLLETSTDNFFEGITELMPGNNLVYDLRTHQYNIENYYQLRQSFSNVNESFDDNTLSTKIAETFEQAVKLRLRSDVEVGTCLSGGIDSSALAVTMAKLSHQPVHCFTAVFKDETINEEKYADSVVQKINGIHHKIEPSLQGFLADADQLIYSQDVPIWSTSTYAQHKVMHLAKENKIKVVLDGQGADELFAGYHHHYVAKWNQQFKAGKIASAFSEIKASSRSIPNPFSFYCKELLKNSIDLKTKKLSRFFKKDFLENFSADKNLQYLNDVNDQLADDITRTRLKIFLKCEDRCGMWHSVESRTPFSDDLPLIDLAFSFDGQRKIKNGISKFLFREALKNQLPPKIYARYDKMGFETPMQKWLKSMKTQLLEEVRAAQFDFLKMDILSTINFSDATEQQFIFKLFVLARWKKIFSS